MTPPRVRILALVLTTCAAVLFVTGLLVPEAGRLTGGFSSYYTASRLISEGVDPAIFYDEPWFQEQTLRFGFAGATDIWHVNPPATTLLFLPIAWLSPERADWVWTVANVVLLLATLVVLRRLFEDAGMILGWREPLTWLLAGVAFVYNPFWQNIVQGQLYGLLMLGLALAWSSYVRGQEYRFGGLLGLMFVFKMSGGLLWLIPLLERRWRSLASGGAVFLVVASVTSALWGHQAWREWLVRLPGLYDQPWSGVTAYQTTNSLIHHLTSFDARFSPEPVAQLPWLTMPLVYLVFGLAVGGAVVLGWFRVRRDLPDNHLRLLRIGMLSALAVPLQPLGEEYHYPLLLPSVLLLLGILAGAVPSIRPDPWAGMLGVFGVLLVTVPLPFKDEVFVGGWSALLAYPKLYGALLVVLAYGILLSPIRERRAVPHAANAEYGNPGVDGAPWRPT